MIGREGRRSGKSGSDDEEKERERKQEREDKAREAMDCPCLDNLKAGPCGKEFTEAFRCFLASGHTEKGTDCTDPYFLALQECINANEKQLLALAPPEARKARKQENLPDIDYDNIKLPSMYKNWKPGDPDPVGTD